MKRHRVLIVPLALATAALLAGCWGSSKETSLNVGVAPTPAKVGSLQCTSTCHAATTDILGEPIATTWANTTHTLDFGVQCEDCHGGGGDHWGVGPIPYPNPSAASCASAACHGLTNPTFVGFTGTAHANSNQIPNGAFTQIATPVSSGRHIQECSVCHNPNQRFAFDVAGNLLKPNPSNLPIPSVTCGSCHDGHQPAIFTTAVKQRANVKIYYPRFRNFLVDNTTGAQIFDNTSGRQVNLTDLNLIFQPNGAVQPDGSVNPAQVVGRNNELHIERLCAACHTAGKYRNSGGTTHQADMYTQWTTSGHGNQAAAAFAEFSANPTAYNPAFPTSHQTRYPYDMALSATGATADNTRNAGNNNFACFKCHNGLASIAHQDNVEGTPAAPVIFGDEPVTCVTCHNPHTDVTGQTRNTRKPVLMTKYSGSTPGNKTPVVTFSFSGNVFLDNNPVPSATGNSTICVFCHQGRESGLTLFKSRLFDNNYVDNNGFFNPHYLGTAAMLWGANGYEYSGKSYGVVTAHQQTNCVGCHMADGARNDVGDHTWKIVSDNADLVNSAACNTAACHNGRVPTTNLAGQWNNFRDTAFDPTNDYDGNGVVQGIGVEIAGLENNVISLLLANAIVYDDLNYPYFFKTGLPHTFANQFKAWKLPTLKAAFNLSFAVKGLPSSSTSAIGVSNMSAAAHDYRYTTQLLHDSYEDLYNYMVANGIPIPGGLPAPGAMARPAGTRPATNYANPGSLIYSPQQ